MSAMEHPRGFDLYEVYAGRCPPKQEAVPRAEWVPAAETKEHSLEIQKELLETLRDCTQKYSWEELFACEVEDKTQRTSILRLEHSLRCHPGIKFGIVSHYTPRSDHHNLAILLMKEKTEEDIDPYIATFSLIWTPDGTLHMNHRIVEQPYRGNHLFTAIMNGLKQFADEMTAQKKHPVRLQLEGGQPELLARILNLGFKPKDEEQGKRIEKMLSGDPSLIVDYAYSKNEEGVERPVLEKLPYCFEKEKIGNDPAAKRAPYAYRAALVYEPQTTIDLDTTRHETRNAIDNTNLFE
jgi:hypothetical protein